MYKEAKNAFNRTFYVIQYNPEFNIIDTLWHGYASKTDLKNACRVGLELTQTVKCPFKLNDNTHFTGPWNDAVAWLEKEWLPQAMKAGLRYLAHVAAPDSFGETAGEVMKMSLIGRNLEVCIFPDREKALAWLKKCQQEFTVAEKKS